MKKLPTAEELAIQMFLKHLDGYSSFDRVQFTGKQLKKVAIEFAKLHVENFTKSELELKEYLELHVK